MGIVRSQTTIIIASILRKFRATEPSLKRVCLEGHMALADQLEEVEAENIRMLLVVVEAFVADCVVD